MAVALAMPAPASALASAQATAARAAATNGLIAFEHEIPVGNHTQTDVDTVGPDGNGVVTLTATPDRNEFGPVWGPDGGRIAFWRTAAPFGTGSLWVMSGNGTNQRRLTVGVDARDPSWNPAGTRLVYDRAADDLFSLNVSNGKGRVQLTSGPALDFEPAWSPDGTRIAFTRGSTTGDPGDIYLLDLTTHAITRVTHSPAYDHQVSWSPAGNALVFERDFGNRSAIYTVGPDGSGLRQLTKGRHFDVAPTYAPDGASIAFGSDRGGVLDQLWVMDSGGHHPHQLTALTFSSGNPSWRAGSA